MKNLSSDLLTTVFYILIAWFWLPALAVWAFHSISWVADGLSEIPKWILFLSLSSLSLIIASYIHCKKNKLDSEFLTMPFRLFLVSIVVLPFCQGYTKALSEGSPVEPSESKHSFIVNFSASVDAIKDALLIGAPVVASLTAIVIVIAYYWPNLRNKNTG